jgi:Fe-S oxidoreductase
VFQTAALPGPIGRVPSRDLSWIDADLRVAEQGKIALFVGCLPAFDALFEGRFGVRTTDIAQSAIRTLNLLDIEPVVIAEERCCGHDLLWGGDEDGFAAVAEANAAAFQARGVEVILTTCAECCRTWRLDYPKAAPDYAPRVQHFVEFLDERLEAGELGAPMSEKPATVTFQDPCRLGRHLGVIDAPRRVLAAAGAELVEMEQSGMDAVCCGTSGFIHCDAASRRLQQERMASAAATGAPTLVTACPKCLIHFACAQEEDRLRGRDSPPIEVEDLTVFATRSLTERTGAVT